MSTYILQGFFFYSGWLILIIALFLLSIFFIWRRRKKLHPSQNKEWYLQFALSKEDAVSQLFLLMSFFFLGVTLLAFNQEWGEPLSWRVILFMTSALGLISTYYLKTIYTLVFSLVGLTSWWGTQAFLWVLKEEIKPAALLVGLAFLALTFYSLGRLHEKQTKYKRFALVYLMLGIVPITGALFFFSTKIGVGVIWGATLGNSPLASWQLISSLFIFLISMVGVTLYATSQKLLFSLEMLAVFALACLFGAIALSPAQGMFYDYDTLSGTGMLWAVIFNSAVFLELLGLIFSGYLRRETWLINLGALFFFLLIIVKYIDWFSSFLNKSIFFIGAGILLFIVGWAMERGRRYMISNIKMQTQQIQQ